MSETVWQTMPFRARHRFIGYLLLSALWLLVLDEPAAAMVCIVLARLEC